MKYIPLGNICHLNTKINVVKTIENTCDNSLNMSNTLKFILALFNNIENKLSYFYSNIQSRSIANFSYTYFPHSKVSNMNMQCKMIKIVPISLKASCRNVI